MDVWGSWTSVTRALSPPRPPRPPRFDGWLLFIVTNTHWLKTNFRWSPILLVLSRYLLGLLGPLGPLLGLQQQIQIGSRATPTKPIKVHWVRCRVKVIDLRVIRLNPRARTLDKVNEYFRIVAVKPVTFSGCMLDYV